MNDIREQIEFMRVSSAGKFDEMADTMEKLLAFYEEADGIIAESYGVDGWHLNGDTASWGEFSDLIATSNAIQILCDKEKGRSD